MALELASEEATADCVGEWEKVYDINETLSTGTSGESAMIHYKTPLLAILLGAFSLLTISGNFLVMLTVYRERRLRTPTNCSIVSLAFADFLIGVLVMPLAILDEMTFERYWPLSEVGCALFRSTDVLASTASILNLCLISVDRYLAVTNPIRFRSLMSLHRTAGWIGLVWITSILISYPPIAWWRQAGPLLQHYRFGPRCEFTDDQGYKLFSALISFYIPLIVMVVVYWKIYRTATMQVRALRRGGKLLINKAAAPLAGNGEVQLRIHRGGYQPYDQHQPTTTTTTTNHLSSPPPPPPLPPPSTPCKSQPSQAASVHYSDSSQTRHNQRPLSVPNSRSAPHMTSQAREQRAAKTLGVVMGVFVLCWLPFFILSTVTALCVSCNSPTDLFSIFTWLGYINSSMNPIIYACSMNEMRRGFLLTLCPQRRHDLLRRETANLRETWVATNTINTSQRTTAVNSAIGTGGNGTAAPVSGGGGGDSDDSNSPTPVSNGVKAELSSSSDAAGCAGNDPVNVVVSMTNLREDNSTSV